MKARNLSVVLAGIPLLACGGVWGWFYYQKHFSQPEPPFQQAQPMQSRPAIGAIVLAAPPNAAQPAVPNQPPSAEPARPPHPSFTLPWDALDEFHKDLANSLVSELGSSFPDLKTTLGDGGGEANNPIFARTALKLLDAYNTAPPDKKPALLLAADLTAMRFWCDAIHLSPELAKASCPDLETDLAKHGVTLHYDELGGGFYYHRDLLWRVWENYADTPSGNQAFVLLLEDGWDTSSACSKGGDQTREVIRRGDEFLQKHPTSPHRTVVTYLIAEAYASWWSLSNVGPDSGMTDYVDPKEFQVGADAARLKAVEYFEKIPTLAPGTKFEKYAQAAAESLRNQEVLKEPRFFCVYD